MSRRQLLRSGLSSLGILAVGNGLLSPAEARQPEKLSARKRLSEKLDWAVQHTEQLTREDVKKEISKCLFVDPHLLRFADLDVAVIQNPFQKRVANDAHPNDTVDENIKLAVDARKLRLSEGGLTVIETNLAAMGLVAGAIYANEHKVILIPDCSPERVRRNLREKLWTEVKLFELIKQGNFNGLDDQVTGDIFDFPDEVLDEYTTYMIDWIDDQVRVQVSQQLHTKEVITHEVAHYFLFRFFETDGYEGPQLVDLLTLGVEQMNQRLLNHPQGMQLENLPEFAQEILPFYQGVNLLDHQEVSSRSQRLIKDFQLSFDASPLTVTEGSAIPREEADRSAFKMQLKYFIQEYFARIYNAATGYTIDSTLNENRKTLQSLNLNTDGVVPADESFLNPTADEMIFIRSMQFDGKPMVKV